MVYLANPTACAQNSKFVPVLLPWEAWAACLKDHFCDEKWVKWIAKATDRLFASYKLVQAKQYRARWVHYLQRDVYPTERVHL